MNYITEPVHLNSPSSPIAAHLLAAVFALLGVVGAWLFWAVGRAHRNVMVPRHPGTIASSTMISGQLNGLIQVRPDAPTFGNLKKTRV